MWGNYICITLEPFQAPWRSLKLLPPLEKFPPMPLGGGHLVHVQFGDSYHIHLHHHSSDSRLSLSYNSALLQNISWHMVGVQWCKLLKGQWEKPLKALPRSCPWKRCPVHDLTARKKVKTGMNNEKCLLKLSEHYCCQNF